MIENLTKEQEAAMPQFVELWTAVGLSTKSVDEEAVKKWVPEAYRMGGCPPPEEVIVLKGGPMALMETYRDKFCPGKSLKEVWNEISTGLCYGAHDSGWLSFYDYFLKGGVVEGGKPMCEDTKKLVPLMELAKAGLGWWLPLDKVAICSSLPEEIHMDKQGRLHREGGPAIVYADGFSVWALNGVRVPQWLAEEPSEKIDPSRLTGIKNAQVRAEFVKKVGIDRICHALKAEVIDKEGDYELILLDIGDGGKRPYLKMKNPSVGCWHVEGVPPKTKTVKQANKFRRGKDFEEEPEFIT